MIRLLAGCAALLYCFPWLRPPELAGIALPIQRVLGWTALACLLGRLFLKGPLTAGPAARGFLRAVALFLGFLVLLLARDLVYGEGFSPLYFLMDLSKYVAAFSMAYLCYYALTSGLISLRLVLNGVMASGLLASLLVFALLGLYFTGYRTETTLIAPSFGGALGVWPTGGWLPRLAGPTAEPQQLSVVLLTPLLLMISPAYIRRAWPLALATGSALLLSQSKFALVSLLLVVLYVFLVYRRWRILVALGSALLLPVLVLALFRLPTFSTTIQQGMEAGAIVERLQNLALLITIIKEHPLFGIGPGYYGTYWGNAVYGDPRYDPGYTPNMDFLKVFAETGIAGFLLVFGLFAFLIRIFARSLKRVSPELRPQYLALFLGALAILLNMLIGYELLHAFLWINIGTLLYFVDATPRPLPRPEGLQVLTPVIDPA
jgi:O-antigen ligase